MDADSIYSKYEVSQEKAGTSVFENVELLKAIEERPQNLKPPLWNYYIEPIEVEYYSSKSGRFVPSIKYLFIELFEPRVDDPIHTEIHNKFKKLDLPIDVVEVMNFFPQHIISILDNYGELIGIHEKISFEIKNGIEGDINSILKALYLTEVVRKREPTLVVFEILGNYIHNNLNWFIRYLNKSNITFSLEDSTVLYLINMFLAEKEQKDEKVPDRFNILKDIYLEQAFPAINRGLEE